MQVPLVLLSSLSFTQYAPTFPAATSESAILTQQKVDTIAKRLMSNHGKVSAQCTIGNLKDGS